MNDQSNNTDINELLNNYKPNRKQRRAKAPSLKGAKRALRRYDKVLAKTYGISKAFRQHAKRHGVSMELLCSNLLQSGAIKYKELPKDPNHSIFWRKA
jgi:hypothetical protein